jgi:hypothetical protein
LRKQHPKLVSTLTRRVLRDLNRIWMLRMSKQLKWWRNKKCWRIICNIRNRIWLCPCLFTTHRVWSNHSGKSQPNNQAQLIMRTASKCPNPLISYINLAPIIQKITLIFYLRRMESYYNIKDHNPTHLE